MQKLIDFYKKISTWLSNKVEIDFEEKTCLSIKQEADILIEGFEKSSGILNRNGFIEDKSKLKVNEVEKLSFWSNKWDMIGCRLPDFS